MEWTLKIQNMLARKQNLNAEQVATERAIAREERSMEIPQAMMQPAICAARLSVPIAAVNVWVAT